MKNWLKSPLGTRISTFFTSIVLRLLLASIRWQKSQNAPTSNPQKPTIFVHWHCRLLLAPSTFGKAPFGRTGRRIPIAYMISPSLDGQLIAGTTQPLGIKSIWGSPNNNPTSGYLKMLRHLKSGQHIGITPDGPRGPARKAALGTLRLAQASGAPIIPVAWSVKSMWRLNSWDRLVIPKPGTKGTALFAKPIYIPKNADKKTLEKMRLELEDAINKITAKADKTFNHTPDDAQNRYGTKKKKRNKNKE